MTTIRASVTNRQGLHEIALQTNGQSRTIEIPPRPGGGSSVSGGELLFLALATCYCNDLYREAAKRGIAVQQVEVDVDGDFEREGGPASNVTYRVRLKGDARAEELMELMLHTDQVAEIHNTLRSGAPVILESYEVIAP